MKNKVFLCILMITGIFLFVFCTTPAEEADFKTIYDVTPPTINSIYISYEGEFADGTPEHAVLDVNARSCDVLIEIEAKDDLTYVRSASCILGSPNPASMEDSYDYFDTKIIDLELNKTTKKWWALVHFDNFCERGEWTVDSINVTDRGYKTRTYYLDPTEGDNYCEKYITDFNPTDIHYVKINKQGSTPPDLNAINITPSPPPISIPSGELTVNVEFDFLNDTYIDNVQIEILSPKVVSGNKGPILNTDLSWNGTNWTADLIFKSYHETGSYLINKITITDDESNTRTYLTDDYSVSGTYNFTNNESDAIYETLFNNKFIEITTGNSDGLNPYLTGLSSDTGTVASSGGTVNITAYFNDGAGSGVYSVSIIMKGPGDDDLKTEEIDADDVTPIGAADCTIPFVFALEDSNGQWKVESVTVTDYAGNYRDYVINVETGKYYYRDSLSGEIVNTDIDVITITKQ